MTPEARPTLTCLIPAYNEGARIAAVLACLRDHPLIDEVLVIDDGSRDDTVAEAVAALAHLPHGRLLRQPQNGGKTRALARGLAEARGSHVLLLDADLTGLTPLHLTRLITPVLSGAADLSISLRDNAPWIWRAIGLDYISGERVLRRDLILPELEALETLPKFGFEVFLNRLALTHDARIAVVRWNGVKSPLKGAKYGLWQGIRGDIGMLRDMARTVPVWRLLDQILRLRARRIA
jgi:hypothetical protein